MDAGSRSGFSSFIASACALLDLQHIGGWSLIQRQANIDSPGGLVGSYIIYLTVPYALGSVGAGVLFATLFGISAIYLFNVNPVMTALNAFSWYREWKIRSEEERLAKAPPKEQLEALRKRNKRKIEELERKAALGSRCSGRCESRRPPTLQHPPPRRGRRTRRAAPAADQGADEAGPHRSLDWHVRCEEKRERHGGHQPDRASRSSRLRSALAPTPQRPRRQSARRRA